VQEGKFKIRATRTPAPTRADEVFGRGSANAYADPRQVLAHSISSSFRMAALGIAVVLTLVLIHAKPTEAAAVAADNALVGG
jgi:cation transport ATPase